VIRKRKFSDSRVQKRTVRVGAHLTSLTVEDEFWEGLKEIARERQLPLNTLITDIHKQRKHANLSSVIRLFVLERYVKLAAERAKPKRRGAHGR
jgi:predicted DNA-binding ribbon-helix-helix protein